MCVQSEGDLDKFGRMHVTNDKICNTGCRWRESFKEMIEGNGMRDEGISTIQ